MEQYYFIEKNGAKLGPYKLNELKQQTIYFNELIWRSDSVEWKPAGEFEELKETIVYKPPLTPKEERIKKFNENFKTKAIIRLILSYILASLVLSVLSYAIAKSSWDKYLADTEGKYLPERQPKIEEGRGPLISDDEYNKIMNDPKSTIFDQLKAASDHSDGRRHDNFITYKELNDNKRYPRYTPRINNESQYGYGQSFWFRPLKAFSSTIYLTPDEQENSGMLFYNLTLSSLASLSFVFLGIGLLYYIIRKNEAYSEPNNAKPLK
jgi:hypothetical protein